MLVSVFIKYTAHMEVLCKTKELSSIARVGEGYMCGLVYGDSGAKASGEV